MASTDRYADKRHQSKRTKQQFRHEQELRSLKNRIFELEHELSQREQQEIQVDQLHAFALADPVEDLFCPL